MRQRKIHDILTFMQRTKGLESQRRYSASLRTHQNTVAEHSWRLALFAYTVATACAVRVDMSKTLALALMHDIAEATTGDIDAYLEQRGGVSLLEKKALDEASAITEMTEGISFGTTIQALWQEYEAQESVESKFIKALDKIEGFLHIAEVGVKHYIPKEFHASYADAAVKAFDETSHHFPEMQDLLDAIKSDLKQQFEDAGVLWIDHGKN